ncbi:hypothetical protein BH11BAC2_BH11BAC2_11000 [soil metagenome]
MKKIETLSDLKEERSRLIKKKILLEEVIKEDFQEIKASLSPVKMVADNVDKVLVNRNFGLVPQLINFALDTVVKNGLLRKSGFLVRIIVPFLAKNAANNYVADHKKQVLGWIADKFLKFGNSKNHSKIYDKTTADINL